MRCEKQEFSLKLKVLTVYQMVYVIVFFSLGHMLPASDTAKYMVLGIMSVVLVLLLLMAAIEARRKEADRETGILILCVTVTAVLIYRCLSGGI